MALPYRAQVELSEGRGAGTAGVVAQPHGDAAARVIRQVRQDHPVAAVIDDRIQRPAEHPAGVGGVGQSAGGGLAVAALDAGPVAHPPVEHRLIGAPPALDAGERALACAYPNWPPSPLRIFSSLATRIFIESS